MPALAPASNGIQQSPTSDLGEWGQEVGALLDAARDLTLVRPERQPSPLFPGILNLVPHYSFAEYDATFGGAVDSVVVPCIPDAITDDPAVLDWIRAKAESGTTIL